jgi:hypothetical protein
MRGHLAAQLKGVRMILVLSRQHKTACATKSKDHKSSFAGEGLYPNRPKTGLSGIPVDDRTAGQRPGRQHEKTHALLRVDERAIRFFQGLKPDQNSALDGMSKTHALLTCGSWIPHE